VEVVSGGITFTASVDACATPFVLQLNFDSLQKVDGVRRTGQYLEFKEGSVFYMFDFGDTPNFEAVTLFVQKVALAAISARRVGVRGLESESVDATDERVRKRNKSASGGGAAGGASDMDVELEVTLEETPAGGGWQDEHPEVNILFGKVYNIIESWQQNFMRVAAGHGPSIAVDMDMWSRRLSDLVKRFFALLLPRNDKQRAEYAKGEECRSLLLALGHSPEALTLSVSAWSARDTDVSGVSSGYVFAFDESTLDDAERVFLDVEALLDGLEEESASRTRPDPAALQSRPDQEAYADAMYPSVPEVPAKEIEEWCDLPRGETEKTFERLKLFVKGVVEAIGSDKPSLTDKFPECLDGLVTLVRVLNGGGTGESHSARRNQNIEQAVRAQVLQMLFQNSPRLSSFQETNSIRLSASAAPERLYKFFSEIGVCFSSSYARTAMVRSVAALKLVKTHDALRNVAWLFAVDNAEWMTWNRTLQGRLTNVHSLTDTLRAQLRKQEGRSRPSLPRAHLWMLQLQESCQFSCVSR
jgi:hypothetical protein